MRRSSASGRPDLASIHADEAATNVEHLLALRRIQNEYMRTGACAQFAVLVLSYLCVAVCATASASALIQLCHVSVCRDRQAGLSEAGAFDYYLVFEFNCGL